MSAILWRIEAPHFTAGLETRATEIGGRRVISAPPIIKYMIGWSEEHVERYCAERQWRLNVIDESVS